MAHSRLHAFGQNTHAPGVLAALDEFVLTLSMRHQERTPEGRWKTGPECAREVRVVWAQMRALIEQDIS